MDIIELSRDERVHRVRFMGVVYRRYPRAKQSSDRNYFRPGAGDVRRHRRSYLHRDLWIAANGPIPDGYELDHRDGDPLNNALPNLQLLPIPEHKAKHAGEASERSRRLAASIPADRRQAMLAKAAEWHRSPEGRAWHSRQSVAIHAAMPCVEMRCDVCGATYSVKRLNSGYARFCSNNCRSEARRRSGVDDRPRGCPCGARFVCNKYSKQKYCSRVCARRHQGRRCTGVQPVG